MTADCAEVRWACFASLAVLGFLMRLKWHARGLWEFPVVSSSVNEVETELLVAVTILVREEFYSGGERHGGGYDSGISPPSCRRRVRLRLQRIRKWNIRNRERGRAGRLRRFRARLGGSCGGGNLHVSLAHGIQSGRKGSVRLNYNVVLRTPPFDELGDVGCRLFHVCHTALPTGSSTGSLKSGPSCIERSAESQAVRGFRASRNNEGLVRAFLPAPCREAELQPHKVRGEG
jgi:hypothetical protein